MNRRRILWFGGACALAGLSVSLGLRSGRLHHAHDPGADPHVAPEAAGFELSDARFATLDGRSGTLSQLYPQLAAEPLLLNFWATWCAPCRAEMPLLDAAAPRLPAALLGIAVADEPEHIRAFLAEVPVEYPILLAQFDIFYFFQKHGNTIGALPFQLLLDNEGGVVRSKVGEFTDTAELLEFAG